VFTQSSALSRARWRARLVLVFLAAIVLPGGSALLYHFPPGESSFYPPCVFHVVTGLHCPGCGATRCLGALVHGDLAQAAAYNPLLVAALPVVLVGLYAMAFRMWTGRRLPLPRLPAWAIYALFCVIVVYAVLRNVDVYPLTLLAPHTL
jgi:hypothetical protein